MQVRTGTVPEHNDGDGEDSERQAIRDLMDPVALEARLVVARARRAEVLAARTAAAQNGQRSTDPREEAASREETALPEETAPSAPLRLQRAHDAEVEAAPETGPLSHLFTAARSRPNHLSYASDATTAPGADSITDADSNPAPIAARNSLVAVRDPDLRMPVRPLAAPVEAAYAVAPYHGQSSNSQSRRRRSATLIAVILLMGAALGVASTLMLQFQGWQIAILPPAVDDGPTQGASPSPASTAAPDPEPAVEPAVEPAATTPSGTAESVATGPESAEASLVPPLVDPYSRSGFPANASAGNVSSASVAPPVPGEPIRLGSLPPLAPAEPVGTRDAQIGELLQPAPAPLVMKSLQALSFTTDAAALPDAPEGAEPERPALTFDTTDTPALPPNLQDNTSPPPPPPAETAPPAPAIAVPAPAIAPPAPAIAAPAPAIAPPAPEIAPPAARVAVHFPGTSSAEADEVYALLTDAGFSDVAAYPVSFNISTTQVRYYHEADRAAAEGVAESASSALGGADVAVRSFTDFRPQPEEGLVEVWVAGEAPASVSQVAATPSAQPATPPAPARQAPSAAERLARQEAERQRLVVRIEQLLRDQLR